MTSDRVEALVALLDEAKAAHGTYEATELNGVYDEEWPRWYAAYAIGHGAGAVLGREVTADELAGFLARSWQEFEAADPVPAEPWGRYTAYRIVAEL